MLVDQKQKSTEEELEGFKKEKEELLQEGRILRHQMLKFLDKQKIKKVQKFIFKQENN